MLIGRRHLDGAALAGLGRPILPGARHPAILRQIVSNSSDPPCGYQRK